MNPNAARGESHWILYQFDFPYELFQMHIWNTNAPDYLMDGMQNIVIDISTDGVDWTEIGEFQVPIADGTSTYEGFGLHDFNGTMAQYVLITGLTNHGGSCFGLSEIRIDVADAIVVSDEEPTDSDCLATRVFPNPVKEQSRAIISNVCQYTPITYSIQDISGRVVQSGEVIPGADVVELNLNTSSIVPGSYILSVQQQGVMRRVKMMKVE